MILQGFAISGKAGTGKTTFAKHLQYQLLALSKASARLSFSTAVAKEVETHFGLVKGDDGWRVGAQKVGSFRRGQDPYYWIDKVADQIDELHTYGVVPIIDDLRFPNEHEYARAKGMVMVRLTAPLEARIRRLVQRGENPKVATSEHESEVALDSEVAWDVIVENSGPIVGPCLFCKAAEAISLGLARTSVGRMPVAS